ncbi:MAG TPA: diguanylate cyclase [Rhodocyclaceae bacterium]|nr:diguanylate cyclase [Rhodocyclaceae bacterium]
MPGSSNGSGDVLIIGDDEIVSRLLRAHLEGAGYGVRLARAGQDGLASARLQPPDLIISAADLPDLAQGQICRLLADDSQTRHIPLMLTSPRRRREDLLAALAAGADDYLPQPLDFAEVVARAHALIRRARLKPALSPLTGLPGNLIIEHEIRELVTPGHGLFAVIYADLNNFKAYNDVYGFPAGDEALRLLARLLSAAVVEQGNPADFVGHVGGDDFVAISTPDRCDAIAQSLIQAFDRQAPELYTPADRRKGYLTTKDRQGIIKKIPLLSVAIAIVHNQYRPISNHWEIGELGAELKHAAKMHPGSAYVKDQRRA